MINGHSSVVHPAPLQLQLQLHLLLQRLSTTTSTSPQLRLDFKLQLRLQSPSLVSDALPTLRSKSLLPTLCHSSTKVLCYLSAPTIPLVGALHRYSCSFTYYYFDCVSTSTDSKLKPWLQLPPLPAMPSPILQFQVPPLKSINREIMLAVKRPFTHLS